MALVGIELETLVSEPDALTTRLGKSLPSPKDPFDVNEITGIIYQVPCHDCPFVYIGQTKRDLDFQNTREQSSINDPKSLLFVSTPSPWTI